MGSSLRRQMGVLAVGLLLSVSGCDTTTAPADDLQKRVDTYFDRAAADIATKKA